MKKIEISISNIHCDNCRDSLQKVLKPLLPPGTALDISVPRGTVIILYNETPGRTVDTDEIAKAVYYAGFTIEDLDVEEINSTDPKSSDLEPTNSRKQHPWRPWLAWIPLVGSRVAQKATEHHKLYCKLCHGDDVAEPSETSPLLSADLPTSGPTPAAPPNAASADFQASFLVSGMTCASCASTVRSAILECSPYISEAGVDVINKTATVVISVPLPATNPDMVSKNAANKIVTSVTDAGYHCELLSVLPIAAYIRSFRVSAVVGGLTCAACVNTVKQNVSELPFVLDCSVSLLTKQVSVVIEGGKPGTDAAKEAELIHKRTTELQRCIEDSGFEFELMETTPMNFAATQKLSRTVNLEISGMYCSHCPEAVNALFRRYGESVVVDDPVTLDRPFVRLTYIPAPPSVTIRSILADIAALPLANGSKLTARVVQPVRLDDRLSQLHHQETIRIVTRLVLTAVMAVPTMLVMILMDMVSPDNGWRQWLHHSAGLGTASRASWALFICATPVYFCAADIFHRKAVKEIRALYKFGVSWHRRLLRFGSMNLLMSLGTSIAYFASVAVLILGAMTDSDSSVPASTANYFDSVVFLTLFLLVGRLLEAYSKEKTSGIIGDLMPGRPANVTIVTPVNSANSATGATGATPTSEAEFAGATMTEIPIELLELGDFVQIPVGQSPPSDAVVVQGTSFFDESALTGEARPVRRRPGEQVFAGTVNCGDRPIVAKIVCLEGQSMFDHILQVVRDGQLHRAPIERVADTLTGYFVPLVTFLAVATWLVWLILGLSGLLPSGFRDEDDGSWWLWSLQFAIAVFVVACPCGIGLAAPTALFVGSGVAARLGILARGGGEAFEVASRVSTVCFDKTGTITVGGAPRVAHATFFPSEGVDLNPELVPQHDAEDLGRIVALQVARDTELVSEHPLARAVRQFCESYVVAQRPSEFLTTVKVTDVTEIAGRGLRGRIDWSADGRRGSAADVLLDAVWRELKGRAVAVGNERLMTDCGAKLSEAQQKQLDGWKKLGQSVILVALQSREGPFRVILMMSTEDEIRPEAKGVVRKLQNHGVDVWMISGDNRVSAEAVAAQVGIPADHVVAEVLPDEKADKIRMLQTAPRADGRNVASVVAMVGDGINDAPALVAADVGIALDSTSDVAMSSADFILLSSKINADGSEAEESTEIREKNEPKPVLLSVLTLLELSQTVLRRVYFNFGWALVYNLIGIPVAAGVFYPLNHQRLDPVWASMAMALSSISVVLSSLALRWFRPSKLKQL